MKYMLSVLVQDKSGVLSRISGLFARRGFNIDSLAVGLTEKNGVSRIIMSIVGDNRIIEQIIKQLYKLINVLDVKNITDILSIERELILIKINMINENKSQILEIVNIFKAKIVEISYESLTLEITGDSNKIFAIQQLLSQYKIIEIVRTGKIALIKDSKIMQKFQNNKV
uniref:Acetolactate synthase small subunit n=1 Tax=Choreocolax polysiphoniae TaxID=282351 RepID=A0A0B5W378_9FLOR|nr:acetolactate synthase small subunit [Choreocolax polysiphoniae]AJH65840.1 acetolactate synthase small subunit [Choreocolax polysiphoniae]